MNAQIKVAAALTFALTLLQSGISHAQQPAPDTAAIRAQITTNGRAVGRAIGAMDFAALEKIWSPDMVVNSPGNNILTRDQVFAAMREDKLKYSSARAIPETFFVVKDVAIEMGHDDIVMSNGPMAGKPLTRRFTNVWQKTGDQWLQIARQATYVGVDGGAVYGHPDPTLTSVSAVAPAATTTGSAASPVATKAPSASSPPQGLTRTDLQRHDLSIEGRETVQTRVDFAPGAASPWHSHPGEELIYVPEGTLEFQLEGEKPVTLKTGDVFFVPAGKVHTARNPGTLPAVELATYIVEKGKPLLVRADNTPKQ
jgi:quercetin dioxygenase-like cupin family protein/ketosteroid isomerase-like protein